MLRTRWKSKQIRSEPRSSPRHFRHAHLCAAWEHLLARSQSRAASLLDLLDLASLLADDGTHARVRHDESDRHRAAAGNRWLIKGLVVDATHDQAECLKDKDTSAKGAEAVSIQARGGS